MDTRSRIAAALFFLVSSSGLMAGELVLVAPHASWRFLDTGADAGTAWRGAAFDDSAWRAGEAQLGYGDGDEVTLVRCRFGQLEGTPCSGADPRAVTTYLRRGFEVEDAGRLAGLTLRLQADDGAVVYLNGQEAARQNMPAGTILFDTLASTFVADENAFVEHVLAPALLVTGTNQIAVEIHQHAVTSSDTSFALELRAADPTLPELTRGPYLQRGTPTSAVVRWRSATAATTRLELGPSPDALVEVTFDSTLETEHQVLLDNLTAETRYFYAVGTDAGRLVGPDSERSFVTPAPAGEGTALRVWVIGDSGTANANAVAVRDAYRRFAAGSTDLWLMLGDNAYPSGTDAEYQAAVFEMYPMFLERFFLWPTIGNHDAISFPSEGDGPYFDMFTLPTVAEAGGMASGTESYYSFDVANVHFVCLDSQTLAGLDPASGMMQWLTADLAATAQPWIVAFFHHPPYTKGSHDSDYLADSGGRLVAVRENLLPVLESFGVDLVLTGHSHSYERSFLLDGHYGSSDTLAPSMIVDGGDGRPHGGGAYEKVGEAARGTVYAVAGSSGRLGGGTLDHPAMLVSVAALGSVVLDFDGLRLDATFVDSTSGVLDDFTIDKELLLFADGFESGNTTVWSLTMPSP